MDVQLTNFVNININYHKTLSGASTRDTAVLIHCKSTQATLKDVTINAIPDYLSADYSHLSGIADYIKAFFDNGGRKLHIISNNFTSAANIENIIEDLPLEQILVGFVNESGSLTLSDFVDVAELWNNEVSHERMYWRIFVAEIPYDAGTTADLPAKNLIKQECLVLKYGSMGVGASVLAYYTQMDVYNGSQDYAFTSEKYKNIAESSKYYVFDDNSIVKAVIDRNLNCDSTLANSVRNIGGNDTYGYAITNQYMLLVLQQLLAQAAINALVTKIKYNDSGLKIILNSLVVELNKFVKNGYLATNKVWTEPDLYYEGYKIINKNSVLSNGYSVTILPFESLTQAELDARQLPKIFVLLADSYPIRKIVITGEVF